uniref:Secreted protein n=1 Tax=Cacopsylla melanoneura TaxID=428564 RepID=A0A8D8TZ13_9HEMI
MYMILWLNIAALGIMGNPGFREERGKMFCNFSRSDGHGLPKLDLFSSSELRLIFSGASSMSKSSVSSSSKSDSGGSLILLLLLMMLAASIDVGDFSPSLSRLMSVDSLFSGYFGSTSFSLLATSSSLVKLLCSCSSAFLSFSLSPSLDTLSAAVRDSGVSLGGCMS